MKRDLEIAPDGDDWVLQEQDGDEIGHYTDQDEAIKDGRVVADARNVELFIKGEDGQIREKDSHGNDPPEIPG